MSLGTADCMALRCTIRSAPRLRNGTVARSEKARLRTSSVVTSVTASATPATSSAVRFQRNASSLAT